MGAQSFSDAFIRAIVPPQSGRIEIADSRCVGLTLRVTASGVRTFTFRYRDRVTGVVERSSLGRYPAISLAVARQMADEQRVKVTKGGNPRKEMRSARAKAAAALTVNQLLDRYLVERVDVVTPKSAATVRSYIGPLRKTLGSRRAEDVTRADIIAFLSERAATAPVSANRLRSIMNTMFGWGIDLGILDTSPMQRIPKAAKPERPRDRVLSDPEIRVLWREFAKMDDAMGLAARCLLLCGQRPGEVLQMERSELFDLDRPALARWEILGAKTKNGRHHVIPLSSAALEIVEEATALQHLSNPSRFVFASSRAGGADYDRQSLARAFKRLIRNLRPAAGEDDVVTGLQRDPPTPHDLRRTAITGMISLGIARDIVKRVVNHAEGDVTERHYDRASMLPEKRAALEAWAVKVSEVVQPPPASAAGTVVPLRGRRRA